MSHAPIRKKQQFMMKKNVFSNLSRWMLAFSMAFGITLAAQAQQGLLVKSGSGNVTEFSYSSVTKLTFANEIMTMVSPAGVSGQTFALSTVSKVTFGNVAISGIDDVYMNASGMKLYPTVANSFVNLKGAVEGSQASIYSITGSKIMQLEVNSDLQSINIAKLKSGIYLMRVNGESLKFSKQ